MHELATGKLSLCSPNFLFFTKGDTVTFGFKDFKGEYKVLSVYLFSCSWLVLKKFCIFGFNGVQPILLILFIF